MHLLRYYAKGIVFFSIVAWIFYMLGMKTVTWGIGIYWIVALGYELIMDLCTRQHYCDEDVIAVLHPLEWKTIRQIRDEVWKRSQRDGCRKPQPREIWLENVLFRLVQSRQVEWKKGKHWWEHSRWFFRLTENGQRRKDRNLEEARQSPPLHGFVTPMPND